MIPRRLPKSAATCFYLAYVAADAQRRRPAPQHLDDGVDLVLVVDAAGVVDAAHPLTSLRSGGGLGGPPVGLRLINEHAPPAVHVGADELPWADIGDGSKYQGAPGQGARRPLDRREHLPGRLRGAEAPPHRSGVGLHGVGRVEVQGVRLREPRRVVPLRAGRLGAHAPVHRGRHQVWFHMYGANLNLDDDGNVESVTDGAGTLAAYYALCEAQGLPRAQRARRLREPRWMVTESARDEPRLVEIADGVTIASDEPSRRARGDRAAARFYVPRDDVRMEHLEATTTETVCPFKGQASYWNVRRRCRARTLRGATSSRSMGVEGIAGLGASTPSTPISRVAAGRRRYPESPWSKVNA